MTALSIGYGRLLSQFNKFEVEDIDIWFYLQITGSGWTNESVKLIITDYVDALGVGDNVSLTALTVLLLADSTIDTVDVIQSSRIDYDVWDTTSYSTTGLKIFITEQAVTDDAKITILEEVKIWVVTTSDLATIGSNGYTIIESILAVGDTYTLGDDVDYVPFITAVETHYGDVTDQTTGIVDAWGSQGSDDITVDANEIAAFAEVRIKKAGS